MSRLSGARDFILFVWVPSRLTNSSTILPCPADLNQNCQGMTRHRPVYQLAGTSHYIVQKRIQFASTVFSRRRMRGAFRKGIDQCRLLCFCPHPTLHSVVLPFFTKMVERVAHSKMPTGSERLRL